MRAPPQSRRSRHRYVSQALQVVQDTMNLQKARKSWHIHKLHKISRKNKRAGTKVNKATVSELKSQDPQPESPIRLTDIANQPSGMEAQKNRKMPLLIASFPKGCCKSPKFNLLESNSLYKSILTRRKYKLKSFHGGIAEIKKGKKHIGDYAIKKDVLNHSQMKINYHRRGVVNSTCLLVDSNATCHPEYLKFDRDYSIRLSDYPSLSIRHTAQVC